MLLLVPPNSHVGAGSWWGFDSQLSPVGAIGNLKISKVKSPLSPTYCPGGGRYIASSPVLFLDSPPERGEEKRAWYTLTAHVQDLHPLAQDPWANGCTGSALGLYVPKAKISQEL